MIGQYCALDAAGEKLMQGAFDRLGLTGRSHDRILRMARAIADLDGAVIGEALNIEGAFERLGLTGRSHDRILRMARTIADLEGAEDISAAHLAEAIQFRSSGILK